ncbi:MULTISPECIES: stage III sporulation protein AF [Bacillus]|uniref:Stage III sporulation protein AF n=1 Tax=Bacillus infantis TaxID=324767 RepID=A0A5D4SSX1_9BACI|nr:MULTISPECIES: stage III sporulation protein AF [Bacillus]MCP1159727.1 stage III sporulation protein AF [Bacillus infantis]PLR72576.1 stage III sporulation protein AF [Bacillus sp. UMB0728]TYS66423.1 stage III sporulation protein AF [Bacillus infantis]
MEFIKEWVTNIILFVLLATVVDMLLPNSSLQKYTKMVTGLLLITIILSPVLKLFTQDFEEAIGKINITETAEDHNMENLIEMKKKEIQASTSAYILEEMAVQLKTDAEKELMEQYGLEISDVSLVVDENNQSAFPENLEKVSIQLKQQVPEEKAVEVVSMVEINTNQPFPSSAETDESNDIASLLAQKWNIKEESIEVMIEGGNKD